VWPSFLVTRNRHTSRTSWKSSTGRLESDDGDGNAEILRSADQIFLNRGIPPGAVKPSFFTAQPMLQEIR